MTTMRIKFPSYATTYDYTTDKGWSMSFAERTEIAQRARQCRKAGDMEGYNLKDAEIAYGKNWLDEYKVMCGNRGYRNV